MYFSDTTNVLVKTLSIKLVTKLIILIVQIYYAIPSVYIICIFFLKI